MHNLIQIKDQPARRDHNRSSLIQKLWLRQPRLLKIMSMEKKTAKVENFKVKIKQEEFEEFINQTIEKNKVINVEFRNWKFEEIRKFEMNSSMKNSRSLYKISFIKCDISKESAISIVNSLINLSQIDLSENNFTVKEAQSICDELNYLDFIYMFKNNQDLSKVKSSNLII